MSVRLYIKLKVKIFNSQVADDVHYIFLILNYGYLNLKITNDNQNTILSFICSYSFDINITLFRLMYYIAPIILAPNCRSKKDSLCQFGATTVWR